MAVSVQWALAATLPAGATSPMPGADGPWCLPGFCPLPVEGGLPSGVMYLAVGLVWLGIAGLWQERQRAMKSRSGADAR